MKVSELARELEPFIINLVNEIIGDRKYSASAGDMTWIQGTPFPTDDASGARASGSVDLQLTDDDSDVCQGIYSAILGGLNNRVDGFYSFTLAGDGNLVDEDHSGAMGLEAYADNEGQFALGASMGTRGDAQGSRFVDSTSILAISSAWQDIGEFSIRTDTTWTFRALVAGIRVGAAESFGYELTGVIENDGGTTTMLASTVTTLYEDDVSYDCQAVADDAADELLIQITDTDNSGAASRWTVHLLTAEVSWAA